MNIPCLDYRPAYSVVMPFLIGYHWHFKLACLPQNPMFPLLIWCCEIYTPSVYISYISNCSFLHLRAQFCEHHPLRLYIIVIIYYYSHIYHGCFLTSLSAFSFSFLGPHFQIKFPSNILRKLNKVNLMMPIINLKLFNGPVLPAQRPSSFHHGMRGFLCLVFAIFSCFTDCPSKAVPAPSQLYQKPGNLLFGFFAFAYSTGMFSPYFSATS